MLQKEDGRKLGWALVILSFAMLINILGTNLNSITGFATYNQGTITTETVDVYVGDEVSYSGCSGYIVTDSTAGCSAVVNGDNCVITATSTGSCYAEFISFYIVTLNIQTTRDATTQNLVASADVNTAVAYYTPEDGLDSEETG